MPFTPHRVGFGAMQLPATDAATARTVLRRAVELGVDHVDTAHFYGDGVANARIRDALHPYPAGLRLATKVGARHGAGGFVPAERPDELRADVEANLRSLGTDRLALVNLRPLEPARGGGVVALAEQLGALRELQAAGAIEHIGISAVGRGQVQEALASVDVACVQNQFNVLDRAGADVLDLCRERGIAFVPFFPLGSAFDGGGPARLAAEPAIAAVAAKHRATPAQVALAWLLAQDERVLLIPGTTSVAHLEANLAAGGLALDADDLAALG